MLHYSRSLCHLCSDYDSDLETLCNKPSPKAGLEDVVMAKVAPSASRQNRRCHSLECGETSKGRVLVPVPK